MQKVTCRVRGESYNQVVKLWRNMMQFNLNITFSQLQTGDSFPKFVSKALIGKSIVCSKILSF